MKSRLLEKGFTLVELMVVVAIIGILSVIAVPNFQKYQAKAKQSEAKLSLSALYTVETAFKGDFDTYASCLKNMGIEQPSQGYYIFGFSAHDTKTADAAKKNGASACDTGSEFVVPADYSKSTSSNQANIQMINPEASQATTMLRSSDPKVGTINMLKGYMTKPTNLQNSGFKAVGLEANRFTAAAVGNIYKSEYDLWYINEVKKLGNVYVGY